MTTTVLSRRLAIPAVGVAASLLACGGSGTAAPPDATTASGNVAPADTRPVPAPTEDAQACQVPTLRVSDDPLDCFDGFGQPGECAGLDLVDIESGLLLDKPEVADVPLATGFVVTFSSRLEPVEEFGLFLYLDLDEDPTTGLDMTFGPIALPGIDRLVGATLPEGEAWTQAVGSGGYDAEIVKDPAQASFRVVGDRAIVLVARALLEEESVMGRGGGKIVTVARTGAGALPDAFTLYVGTARSIDALDYLNIEEDIQVPLAATVPEEALYPVCPGGS